MKAREEQIAPNRRSRVITEGDPRSKPIHVGSVGFTPSDFDKPAVGAPHGYPATQTGESSTAKGACIKS